MNGRLPILSEPMPPRGAKIIGIMVNVNIRIPEFNGE